MMRRMAVTFWTGQEEEEGEDEEMEIPTRQLGA